MSCGAGHPDPPCPFGIEGRSTRAKCGPCKNYIPPRHILEWCRLYDREKIICKLPIKACATCVEKNQTAAMREPGQFDWNDPEQVKAYYRGKYDEKRAQQAKRRLELFEDKHPTYWRDYRRRIRAKEKEQKGK